MWAGAFGTAYSQAFGKLTGITDKFDWKAVATSALASGVGAGMGQLGNIAKAGSKLGKVLTDVGKFLNKGKFVNDVVRGALGSAITQGIGKATGLQDKFSWAGVAAAGIGAGVSGAVTRGLSADRGYRDNEGRWTWKTDAQGNPVGPSFGNKVASTMADTIAQAIVRSAMERGSFGDHLMSSLPSALGNLAGGVVGDAVEAAIAKKDDEAFVQSMQKGTAAALENLSASLSNTTEQMTRAIGNDLPLTTGRFSLGDLEALDLPELPVSEPERIAPKKKKLSFAERRRGATVTVEEVAEIAGEPYIFPSALSDAPTADGASVYSYLATGKPQSINIEVMLNNQYLAGAGERDERILYSKDGKPYAEKGSFDRLANMLANDAGGIGSVDFTANRAKLIAGRDGLPDGMYKTVATDLINALDGRYAEYNAKYYNVANALMDFTMNSLRGLFSDKLYNAPQKLPKISSDYEIGQREGLISAQTGRFNHYPIDSNGELLDVPWQRDLGRISGIFFFAAGQPGAFGPPNVRMPTSPRIPKIQPRLPPPAKADFIGPPDFIGPKLPAAESNVARTASSLQGARLNLQLAAEQTAGARAPTQISSFATHLEKQIAGRDGGIGISRPALDDAFANPLNIRYAPSKYGPTFQYIGKDATIVVNPQGRAVTGWGTNAAGTGR
jgi:hypothetical protein